MSGKNQKHEVSLKMIIDGLGKFVQDQNKASTLILYTILFYSSSSILGAKQNLISPKLATLYFKING